MTDEEHISTLDGELLQSACRLFLYNTRGYLYRQLHTDLPQPAPEFLMGNTVITQSRRDVYRQAGLWSQGREWDKDAMTWYVVNESLIVTRTLDSKHLHGKAFDIAIKKDGKVSWPDPAKEENRKTWLILADFWRKMGYTAGAFWKKPDYLHFEV